ncbi:S26 family signal peptidase [Microbispora sp. NPDC088329]|uniref:S26 family signal peptidase n=1 Tax=unclassified Microbispora TaxID=2614687 RepID=UPI0034169D84
MFALTTVALLAAGAGAAIALIRRIFLVVEVEGRSMEPSLSAGDRVLVRRQPRRGQSVSRGEIVVIARIGPGEGFVVDGGPQRVIKRVAAVAGDPVPPMFRTLGEEAVPPGHILVLGDNLEHSADSRQWGFLPMRRVAGIVARRLPPGPSEIA